MTTTPSHSIDELNPDYRVNATSAGPLRSPGSRWAPTEKLVVNGGALYGQAAKKASISGGVVDPGPTHFTSGDVSGEIYRYIVWRNDETCGSSCPGEQDYKQIVVAVKLDTPRNQAAERGYVEVQSNFVDPTDSPERDPMPDADGEVVTAQQFFLTDTPCARKRGDGTRGNQPATTSSTTPLAPAPTARIPGRPNPARPTRCCSAPPPTPRPKTQACPAALRLCERLLPRADTRHRQGRPDPPRRHHGCHYVPTGTDQP